MSKKQFVLEFNSFIFLRIVLLKILKTSMHSSRMRTARLLTHPGGVCIGGGDVSASGGGCLHLGRSALRGGGGVCLEGCLHPGVGCGSTSGEFAWGGLHPGGLPGGWGSSSGAVCTPPVNRMTHGCNKSITLPQTSFADGNNDFRNIMMNIRPLISLCTRLKFTTDNNRMYYYHPPSKLREGNVFSRASLFGVWGGVSM